MKPLVHFRFTGMMIVFCQLLIYSCRKSAGDNYNFDYDRTTMKINKLKLPDQLTFAGENVPMNDFSVIDCLEREFFAATYWQSQAVLLNKRADQLFPLIEKILKKSGIPDDFKYLAVVESGLTNAISPSRATGYWQLAEETAKSYGLEVDSAVDERCSIEKSTEAACKYFKEAYKKFNNWTLVAASYDIGISGLQNQLNKQKTSDYYNLYLNEETGRYVYRILAVKYILSRPQSN